MSASRYGKDNHKGLLDLPTLIPVVQLCHADQPLYVSLMYEALVSSLSIPNKDIPRLRLEKDWEINLNWEPWGDL